MATDTVNAQVIEEWALNNPQRAYDLGAYLFAIYSGQVSPDDSKVRGKQPETAYIEWAQANKWTAMNLFAGLQAKVRAKLGTAK